jgi:5-carboxymethyl-2-hydroxymuconate isomerase
MKNGPKSLAMCQIIKRLSVESQTRSKLYPIRFKRVSLNCGSGTEKTRRENMKVSLAMLLKTHVEKMSENRSLAMLMKSKELKSLSGDVYERKGS